jgi:hypothetical protein
MRSNVNKIYSTFLYSLLALSEEVWKEENVKLKVKPKVKICWMFPSAPSEERAAGQWTVTRAWLGAQTPSRPVIKFGKRKKLEQFSLMERRKRRRK